MVEKAKKKLADMQANAEQSLANENETQAESEVNAETETGTDVRDEVEKPSEVDGSAQKKEAVNEAIETVNLTDSLESSSSDLECTNGNAADTEQSATQQNEDQENKEEDNQMDDSSSETEQHVDEPNETADAVIDVDSEQNQNEQNSVELIENCDSPQQSESQTEQHDEDSNDITAATTHEGAVETDFTENEAQSMDDNSNDADNANACEDGAGEHSDGEKDNHGEITSTNENEAENDVEMTEANADEENTASSSDKMDCESMNSGAESVNDLNDVDNIIMAATDDIVNEVIANDDDSTDVAEIVLEETVDDLNGCNQLTDVICDPQCPQLDVASLFDNGDLENISSPEAFN